MSDLIDTTEMYLKTVFELIEDGVVPLRARIAERLGHSGPTVSQTVARLERDGLMIVSGDRHLELTDEGMSRATRVMRKHRLAERLLTDVIGLDWPHVHEEACRWEHVMSDQVEGKLVDLLKEPGKDPYGNPIPQASGPIVSGSECGVPVMENVTDEAREVMVVRIGEPLQVDVELLREFQGAGIEPGARVRVRAVGESLEISGFDSESTMTLPPETARHIFIAK